MPDFTIEGDAAGIRGRASTLRAHGEDFVATGDALAAISTEGWTGRAAQRFNDKFETEPQRWRDAGDGFVRAAGALEDFAAALDSAQQRAAWAEAEYARGERETESARSAYDADVSQARQEVANAAAGGQFMTLTILPFRDPGQAIRDAALRELESAKADLEATAQQCAAQVRAGCEAAPAKRRWYQKVGDNFVEFFSGAGEALMDLAGMVAFIGNPGLWMLNDMITDLQSGMTEEEIAAKNRLRVEDAQAIFTAFREDPAGFGLELGKAILDWDTWKDNPARAAGRLLPDAVIAVLTAGGGAAARGARGVDGAIDGALDASAGLRRLDGLDDVGAARRLDELGEARHADDSGVLPRRYVTYDDRIHESVHAPEQLGHGVRLDDVLADVGWTRDDAIRAINQDPATMSAADRARLITLRDAVPQPDEATVLQKVITPEQVQALLRDPASAHPDLDPRLIRGSMTRADDTAHLGSPGDLHDGLRLDYHGTPYSASDESMHVIRFTSEEAGKLEAPRTSSFGGGGRYEEWSQPFTGNGFTSAKGDVLPEWQPNVERLTNEKGISMNEGAEMWEVLDSGTQRLVGVLRGKQWVPVG